MTWDDDTDDDTVAKAFLTFEVGEAVFAVAVDRVNEILDLQPLKPVPGAPAMVKGMINVRGRSIVTMDGTDVLKVAPTPSQETDEAAGNDRLIVFEFDADPETAGSGPALLAVRVNRVRAVESFLAHEVDPAPTMASPQIIASSKRDDDTVLFVELDPLLTGAIRAVAPPSPAHAAMSA